MNRPIYIMTGVLLVGALAYFLVSRDPYRVEEKEKFLTVDTSKVNHIHLSTKEGAVTLKKTGSKWKLTEPIDFPANDSYVKTLLEKVGGLEYENAVTSSKDKYAQYELGDSAIYVELGDEAGKKDKFYSGKPSSTYTHTYMRKEGSDEVWLVSGSPKSSFNRRLTDWRDKKVLELDKTMLTKILLKFPDETIELNRQIATQSQDTTLAGSDTTWMVTTAKGETFKPDQKPLNRIMNTITRINSIDFKDAPKDTMPSFSKIDFGVEVFLEGNQHEVIDFTPKLDGDGSRWFARKNGNENTIYVLYQSSVKNLMKRVPELKTGEEPPKPKDDKTLNIQG
jgi:hypothetical protein